MRETILNCGGEAHFQSRVTELTRSSDGKRIVGARTSNGGEFIGDAVILATGHSARDIYRILDAEGVRMEPKPFAVGVRIEHPQELIDSIQYSYTRGEERHRMGLSEPV